jgi:NAD(P)-dependent dehydrogenase (short-subunit alcohol dehydrogenase family)
VDPVRTGGEVGVEHQRVGHRLAALGVEVVLARGAPAGDGGGDPLGRSATPDAVLFLASEASRSITGETINVSGGSYMRP